MDISVTKHLKSLFKACSQNSYRSIILVIGPKARLIVPVIHILYSKFKPEPSIIWCSNEGKAYQCKKNNSYQQFVLNSKIEWCKFFSIPNKIFDILVIQDFSSINLHLLAKAFEIIRGGGIVIILFDSLSSLNDIENMKLSLHNKNSDKLFRFNKLFWNGITSCPTCLALNDKGEVLIIHDIPPLVHFENCQLTDLSSSLKDSNPIGPLISLSKTLDQAHALISLVGSLSSRNLKDTLSLSGPRGSGKSAALGLGIVAAIYLNYSNIFIISSSLSMVQTTFSFIITGLKKIGYEETDFEVFNNNGFINRINIYRDHRQTIKFIHPSSITKNDNLLRKFAELVVIEEAALVPQDKMELFLGSYIVFLSFSTSGIESGGLASVYRLRRKFSKEYKLQQTILYNENDPLELFLNNELCFDSNSLEMEAWTGCPRTDECFLYEICIDKLFDNHDMLKKVISFYMSDILFDPNFLQNLDNFGRKLFVLLPEQKYMNEMLCIIDVLEEQENVKICKITSNFFYEEKEYGYGKRSIQLLEDFYRGFFNVDLGANHGSKNNEVFMHLSKRKIEKKHFIEVEFSLNYENLKFFKKSGFHVKEIGSRPDDNFSCQAIKALIEEGFDIEETNKVFDDIQDKRNKAELNYANEALGSLHTSNNFKILDSYEQKNSQDNDNLKEEVMNINESKNISDSIETKSHEILDYSKVLKDICSKFHHRLIYLLSYHLNVIPSTLAVELLSNPFISDIDYLSKEELEFHINLRDLKRLEVYCQLRDDYRRISDLFEPLAQLYFQNRMDVNLTVLQKVIMAGIGLQAKSLEEISNEINLSLSSVIANLLKALKKFITVLNSIHERAIESELGLNIVSLYSMKCVEGTLEDELEDAAVEVIEKLKSEDKTQGNIKGLEQYCIKGNDDVWDEELKKNNQRVVIKRLAKQAKLKVEALEKPKKRKENFKKRNREKMENYRY